MLLRRPLLSLQRSLVVSLRVGGALALLDALDASGCPLKVLDLSSNELCGGTVAEGEAHVAGFTCSAVVLRLDGAEDAQNPPV